MSGSISGNRASQPAARRYACALLACVVATGLCLPLAGHLDIANIGMLLLLVVALIAVLCGKGPAALAAVVCVASLDFFFVEPRLSFEVRDIQYLVTLGVMLLVALLVAQLSTILQTQLRRVSEQEHQARLLYECAHSLAGAVSMQQIIEALQSCLQGMDCSGTIHLFLPDDQDRLYEVPLSGGGAASSAALVENLLALTVYQDGSLQHLPCENNEDQTDVYLPLRGATRMRGVLSIRIPHDLWRVWQEENGFPNALASLTATAFERLHFVDVAQQHAMQIEAEKLRSSILSAISHDIRTPLTVLCGLADALKIMHPSLTDEAMEIVDALRNNTVSLHGMVEKLLDMARLQSGTVSLAREWLPVEEVVGASIRALGDALAANPVKVDIADDVPLLEMDPLLMERVFCNVLDNARHYSPLQSQIIISVDVCEGMARVCICNDGEGFPAAYIEKIPALFERGTRESSIAGFGLGLVICRSIVAAHGGSLQLSNPPSGGACVTFTLPLGTPPVMVPEEDGVDMS